jgi:hypothetical protein
LRALSQSIRTVARRAHLRIDFRTAAGIGSALGLLDPQRAGAQNSELSAALTRRTDRPGHP